MNEHFADRLRKRAKQQEQRPHDAARESRQSQAMTLTLLGDFLFPTDEPPGCDPYNSVQGKPSRES
jgi:hypothetical protein